MPVPIKLEKTFLKLGYMYTSDLIDFQPTSSAIFDEKYKRFVFY